MPNVKCMWNNGTRQCLLATPKCVKCVFWCVSARARVLSLTKIDSHWHINREIRSRIRLQCECITPRVFELQKKARHTYTMRLDRVTESSNNNKRMIQWRNERRETKNYSENIPQRTPNTCMDSNAWITDRPLGRSVLLLNAILFCVCLQWRESFSTVWINLCKHQNYVVDFELSPCSGRNTVLGNWNSIRGSLFIIQTHILFHRIGCFFINLR